MRDLIKQEQFELEILDRLNSAKMLQNLVFGGGTMLRLCHGLNRFSVDLDFWFIRKVDFTVFFRDLKAYLQKEYTIKDAQNKYYTILFEIARAEYPRHLKIEMRKEIKKFKYEESIAFSTYSNKQVLLKTVKLQDIMESKIEAFLNRGEIRDCFDMEFLIKKGVELPQIDLLKVLEKIEKLTKKDYTVKLGSILEEKDRQYYRDNNFKILKSAIQTKL